MKCPYCGTENPELAQYCGGCGIKEPLPPKMDDKQYTMVMLSFVLFLAFAAGLWSVHEFSSREQLLDVRSAYLEGYGPRIFSHIVDEHFTQVQWYGPTESQAIPIIRVSGLFNSTYQEVEFYLLFHGRRKTLELAKVQVDGAFVPLWEAHSILSYMYGRIPGL